MKSIIKKALLKIPLLEKIILLIKASGFNNSIDYWEKRYKQGDTSGLGSHGKFAEFKAKIINTFVEKNSIKTIIEFGCGDGNQLSYFVLPSYIGLDVSKIALEKCVSKFKNDTTKRFFYYDPFLFVNNNSIFQAELALSLEVIFHLVEDNIYEKYIQDLFSSVKKYVIIYSSNFKEKRKKISPHVRHREFTKDIIKLCPDWHHIKTIKSRYPEETFSDFFIFKKGAF